MQGRFRVVYTSTQVIPKAQCRLEGVIYQRTLSSFNRTEQGDRHVSSSQCRSNKNITSTEGGAGQQHRYQFLLFIQACTNSRRVQSATEHPRHKQVLSGVDADLQHQEGAKCWMCEGL